MSHLVPFLNKKYILAFSDKKLDEAMKAMGVGYFFRNMVNVATPVIQLTEEDGEYTLAAETVFRNVVIKFRLGERFDFDTPDGRRVEMCFTLDENRLIEVQSCRGKSSITVREFTPEGVKITMKVDDIVSVRIYKVLN